jgi:ribose transport system substrate-binding protein
MNPAYTLTINGAKEEIQKLGLNMDFIIRAPTSNVSTLTDQGNILEDLVGRKVDAIALATESDKAMLPYLREAAKANIPVFLFNMSTIDSENNYYVTSIGYDQKKAGSVIGEWVANHFAKGNIGLLTGYPGIVDTQRMDGFKEAIAKNTGLKIVASQIANWNRADGQKVAESMLTAHPEIDILFSDYDEMTLGALSVVKDRQLLDKVKLIGFGAEQAGIDAVKDGTFQATVLVHEYATGYDIIDSINNFCIKGQNVEKVIYREPTAIDASNVDKVGIQD